MVCRTPGERKGGTPEAGRPYSRDLGTAINELVWGKRSGEKMNGKKNENLYRIREGSFRIVYTPDAERHVYRILKVSDRKDVYR